MFAFAPEREADDLVDLTAADWIASTAQCSFKELSCYRFRDQSQAYFGIGSRPMAASPLP